MKKPILKATYCILQLSEKAKLLAHNLQNSLGKTEIEPGTQRARRIEERGRPLQIAGGRFNKQGNLQRRVVLGSLKTVNLNIYPPKFLSL